MKFLCVGLLLACYTHFSLGQSDCFGEGIPRVPATDAVAKGADDFAIKLFTDIAVTYPHNSIVLSPYSVWSVLNLAYFGAGGNTATQLQRALGVPSKSDSFYGGRVIESVLKLNKGTIFDKADKAYFANDIELRQCSLNKLTELERIDFTNTQSAAQKINKDVALATKDKIPNFLSAQILRNARFLLINAVYFKGLWTFPFVKSRTTMKPFYNEARTIEVSMTEMMTTQAKLRYVDSAELDASVLELPYENSNISMILLLPTFKKSTVNQVLKKLTSDNLDRAISQMKIRTTTVSLPRFKMTTRIANELKTGLQKLGVQDLFEGSKINLTNFVPNERVLLDNTLHHATIEVTEEGTVAAAVTTLIGTRSGQGNMAIFNAERPFIFLIRDVRQGITLFIGVLRNPNHTTPFNR